MYTTPSQLRITARDRAALQLLCTLRAVRLDDLGRYLTYCAGHEVLLSPREQRRIVHRWKQAGLAEAHRLAADNPGTITATTAGAAISGWGGPVGLPAWSDVPHILTTAAVAIHYTTTYPVAWTAESELTGNSSHRPDGIATHHGQAFAVEVERNTKSASRWQRIITDLLNSYSAVHYWTTPETERRLNRWLAHNITTANRARIKVYPLGRLAR